MRGRWYHVLNGTSATFPPALPQTLPQAPTSKPIRAVETDPMESQEASLEQPRPPDLLRKPPLMRRGRPVCALLAEIHAGLGSPKAHIPTSTNDVGGFAPGQADRLETGAKQSNVSSISLDGTPSSAIWILKRRSFGLWMACSTCVVEGAFESGVWGENLGTRTAALVTPS